jgi:hypothetical protein
MGYPHYSQDCHEHHGLVRNFGGSGRPPITVLCGSTKFKQAFIDANRDLTLAGHVVLSVGLFGHHEPDFDWSAVKGGLDDLHKRKIDLADEVLVLNVGGYIGDSTRSEIEYAERLGKPISYIWQPVADKEADDA